MRINRKDIDINLQLENKFGSLAWPPEAEVEPNEKSYMAPLIDSNQVKDMSKKSKKRRIDDLNLNESESDAD